MITRTAHANFPLSEICIDRAVTKNQTIRTANQQAMLLAQIFADISRPAPPFYRTAVARMVQDYAPFSGEHETEHSQLNAFLAQDTQRCGLLTAPTGRGKTALLIHWLAEVYHQQQWNIIFISISMRYQTASRRITLRTIAQSLATFHNDQEHMHIYNMSPDQLRPLVASYLRLDAPDKRRLLLVIDGLDETPGWHIGRDIFPAKLGNGIHVLASIRRLSDTTVQHWLDLLGWTNSQTWHLTLPELRRDEIQKMLTEMCQPLNTLPMPRDVPTEIGRISEGDPLTMRLLVHALYHRLFQPEILYDMQPGLEAWIRYWLRVQRSHTKTRTIRDYPAPNSDLAQGIFTFIGLCATALGTLSADDIQELAPDIFQSPELLQQVVAAVSGFITGHGSETDGFVFEHVRLREIFREQIFSPQEREQFIHRFVSYGQEWFNGHRTTLSSYVRRYWIEHLAESGAWEHIGHVLTCVRSSGKTAYQPWVTARFTVEGNYVGYLSDLDMLWRRAEQQHQLTLGLHCALIASTLRSMSGNLLPELLERLVVVGTLEGRWSMSSALKQVRQMTAPGQKLKVLKALIKCSDCTLPYELVRDIIGTFTDESWRSEAIAAIVDNLHPSLIPEMLETAQALTDQAARDRARIAIAPYLSIEQQHTIYADTLASVHNLNQDRLRTRTLTSVIPHLPADMLPAAYEAVCSISYEKSRMEALMVLATHPHAAQWTEISTSALGLARQLMSKEQFADALKIIVLHVPSEQQAAIYHDMVQAIRAMDHAGAKALSMIAIAPYLPSSQELFVEALQIARSVLQLRQRLPIVLSVVSLLPRDQQEQILIECLTTAQALPDERERAEALMRLAHNIPSDCQVVDWETILPVARSLSDQKRRAAMLIALLPHLDHQIHDVVCQEVFVAIEAIEDEWQRAEKLAALAPHVPATLHTELLNVARTIGDGWQRAEALTAIAPFFPTTQQPALYAESLRASRMINDQWQRSHVMMALAHLCDVPIQAHILANALHAAHLLTDERQQVAAMIDLLLYLPRAQYDEVATDILAKIQQSQNQKWSIEALAMFLPHMSEDLLAKALDHAEAYGDVWHRLEMMCVCLPRVPIDKRNCLCATMLATSCQLDDGWKQAELLAKLALHLPADLHTVAVNLIRTIRHERHRMRAIGTLFPVLSASLLNEMMTLVQSITNEQWQCELLLEVWKSLTAEHEHSEGRGTACCTPTFQACADHFFRLANEMSSAGNRARVLSALIPWLPVEQQAEVAETILALAPSVFYVSWRTDILIAITPYLPSHLRANVLEIARSIGHAEERTRALGALLAHQPDILPEMLASIQAIADDTQRAHVLIAFAPTLTDDLITDALTIAATITNTADRFRALVAFLPLVAEQQKHPLLVDALHSARDIPDAKACALALAQLAPHMPLHQQPEIFAESLGTAHAITNKEACAETLALLAPHLADWTRATSHHHPAAIALWQASIRLFTTDGRATFLTCLQSLLPWLTELAPKETIREMVDAMISVSQCWP